MACVSNLSIEDLSSFHSEIERGCMYKVKAKDNHRAGYEGIIEAPAVNIPERGIPYIVIPIDSIRKELFDVEKEEVGDLVDVGFRDEWALFLRVVWKRAIQVYYPREMAEKFSFVKIDPIRSA